MSFATSTIVGDLLHHAGLIVDVRTGADGAVTRLTWSFAGYADLKANAFRRGLQVIENPDGTISLQTTDPDPGAHHDLWAIGTNLLNQAGAIRPAVSIDAAAALDNHTPAPDIPPIIEEISTRTYSWSTPAADLTLLPDKDSIDVDYPSIRPLGLAEATWGQTVQIHAHTLADLLSFNPWTAQDPGYAGADTDFGQYTGRDAVLTANGLTVRYSLSLPLDSPLQDLISPNISNAVLDATANEAWAVDALALTLVNARTVTFDGYGWPAAGAATQAFLSPRRERMYAPMTLEGVNAVGQRTWQHPNVADEVSGKDGADWSIANLPQVKDKAGIRVLGPLELAPPADDPATWPNKFEVYRNPDVLWEFASRLTLADAAFSTWYLANRARLLANQVGDEGIGRMVWLPALREHYNAIANAVNAITSCRPFSFLNFRFGDRGATLLPNSLGLWGGNVRPAGHFRTVEKDSDDQHFWASIGIPIRTLDDMPDSYKAWMADPIESYNLTVDARADVRLAKTTISQADYTFTVGLGAVKKATQQVAPYHQGKQQQAGFIFSGTADMDDFLWISADDLQAKAEAMGFLFYFERLTIPYVLLNWRRAGAKIVWEKTNDPTQGQFSIGLPNDAATNTLAGVHPGDLDVVVSDENKTWWLAEALDGDAPEFIIDAAASGYQIASDYKQGDIDTVGANVATDFNLSVSTNAGVSLPVNMTGAIVVTFSAPGRWARQQDGVLRRARADLVPDGYHFGASMLLQIWASAGLARNSRGILIPLPTVEHTTVEYSREGLKQALARLVWGAQIIPLQETNPQEPGAGAVTTGSDNALA